MMPTTGGAGHWWLCVAILMAVLLLWLANRCLVLWPLRGMQRTDLCEAPFEAGDVLLFSGAGLMGPLGAAVLKLMGNSPYTHVGVVYRDPRSRHLYVWEMIAGVDDGGESGGAVLSSLHPRLASYAGEVAVRHLRGDKKVDERLFEEFVRERWGQKYAYSFYLSGYQRCFDLLPPLGLVRQRRTTLSPRFCGDLIAETLEALGVLDYHGWPVPAASALPRDFASRTQYLPLAPGWRLGEETLVVGNNFSVGRMLSGSVEKDAEGIAKGGR